MLLAVRTSSYGCTWEVWRALKKLELLSATPRATLTLLSCSPNFPRASITRNTHAKHEPIIVKKELQQRSINILLRTYKSLNVEPYVTGILLIFRFCQNCWKIYIN